MDSINKNQPEDNYKDLGGSDALKKLKALVDSAEPASSAPGMEAVPGP
ncbi:hypothetical protein [Massilia antarctica]|nr:hypothetical protein [Massilia sp. H27-R4]